VFKICPCAYVRPIRKVKQILTGGIGVCNNLYWLSLLVCLFSYTYLTPLYCSADEDIDSTFPTNIIVSSPGSCLWVPPGLFLSTCKIDIQWFPFDDQHCKMKFGSWTYDSSGIDLQLQAIPGDISSFIANGEWQLISKNRPMSVSLLC